MSDEGGHDNEGDRADESRSGTDAQASDLLDGVLSVLTERRRRYALYYLHNHELCEIDDLARYLILSTGKTASLQENQLEEMKLRLLHTDLPVLADAGFIDYDSRSETVRYSDPPSFLEAAMAMTRKIDRPDGLN